MKEKLRIGILGYGFMGKTHANNLLKIPNVQVSAIYSAIDEPNLPPNVTFHKDWKPLLDDANIDAVIIATPTFLHTEQAIYAVNKHKHIFIEKPMALNVEECDAILKAAKQNNIKVAVGHVLRFWPSYQAAKEAVQSRDTHIGDLKMIRARRYSGAPNWAKWFADEKLSGGCILDLSIHDIDFATWCFSAKAIEVYCEARRLTEIGFDNWGISFTTIKYEENKIAHCEASWAGTKNFPFSTDCEIMGTNGIIRFDSAHPIPIKMYGEVAPEIQDPYDSDGYMKEMIDFITALQNNTSPSVSGEDGRYAVAICCAAIKSAHEKRPILMAEVLK